MGIAFFTICELRGSIDSPILGPSPSPGQLSVDLVRYSFDNAPAFVTSVPLLRESAFIQLREDYMKNFPFEVFAMVSSVG